MPRGHYCALLCFTVRPCPPMSNLYSKDQPCASWSIIVLSCVSRSGFMLQDAALCSMIQSCVPTLCIDVLPCAPRPIPGIQCPFMCPNVHPCAPGPSVAHGPSLCPTVHSCNPRFSHALSSPVFQDPPYVPMSSLVLKGPALCSVIQPCVQKSSIVLSGPALCSKVQP